MGFEGGALKFGAQGLGALEFWVVGLGLRGFEFGVLGFGSISSVWGSI